MYALSTFSFIIHVSFFALLHYSVGDNSQTDHSRQSSSRKQKIDTTGCIQTAYYQNQQTKELISAQNT